MRIVVWVKNYEWRSEQGEVVINISDYFNEYQLFFFLKKK